MLLLVVTKQLKQAGLLLSAAPAQRERVESSVSKIHGGVHKMLLNNGVNV